MTQNPELILAIHKANTKANQTRNGFGNAPHLGIISTTATRQTKTFEETADEISTRMIDKILAQLQQHKK